MADFTDIRDLTDIHDLSLYFLEDIDRFRSGSGIPVWLPLLNRHPLLKSFEFRALDYRQVRQLRSCFKKIGADLQREDGKLDLIAIYFRW